MSTDRFNFTRQDMQMCRELRAQKLKARYFQMRHADEDLESIDALSDALAQFDSLFSPPRALSDIDSIDTYHWRKALIELTDFDLTLAARFWVRTGNRYPTPADLLECHRLIVLARTLMAEFVEPQP